jgi:TonB family protein
VRGNWPIAIAASSLLHGLLGAVVPPAPSPPAVQNWHDSVMIEIPEPPPPPEVLEIEPPPAPEPPPPPEPLVIQAEDLPEIDTPETAPPPDTAAAVAPPVQGLTQSSFSESGTTGLTVRAGTTLRAAASTKSLRTPVARPAAIGWSEVAKRPRCRPPAVQVPASVIEEGLQGEVHIRMHIGADGSVQDVRVIRGLSTEADAACVAAWSSVTCRPAKRGKLPVAVSNMPHSCIYKVVR